jgi:two-component system, NarL family, sensor kinase
LDREPAVHESVSEISVLLNRAITETRTISHLLHPPLLDEIGLESALAVYIDGFGKRSGISVTVDVAPDLGRLESDVETALFRVVQECLLNVHRHSNSATASVSLERQNGDIRLQVRDEGVGMNTSQDGTSLGVGLLGIRERIRQLDGTLEIVSVNGGGTRVVATIPNRPQKPSNSSPLLSLDSPATVKEPS